MAWCRQATSHSRSNTDLCLCPQVGHWGVWVQHVSMKGYEWTTLIQDYCKHKKSTFVQFSESSRCGIIWPSTVRFDDIRWFSWLLPLQNGFRTEVRKRTAAKTAVKTVGSSSFIANKGFQSTAGNVSFAMNWSDQANIMCVFYNRLHRLGYWCHRSRPCQICVGFNIHVAIWWNLSCGIPMGCSYVPFTKDSVSYMLCWLSKHR